MKAQLQDILSSAIKSLQDAQKLPAELQYQIQIDRSKSPKNGDFACNIALILAKQAQMPPRQLAELIKAAIPATSGIKNIEIAGPGFINFFLQSDALSHVVNEILASRSSYGTSKTFAGEKALIEFVSSNPTGPLHVGHGRGAAYGASLANILEAVGYEVLREYYVNDAGRQMDILATSLWLRYLELNGVSFDFPRNGYKGDYIKDMAHVLNEQVQDTLMRDKNSIFANVPADEDDAGNGDKEKHIDALIENAKALLGADYRVVFNLALQTILDDIREDLAEYRVRYDNWYSEQSLVDNGAIEHALDVLAEKDLTYTKEGALWFRSSDFGDEKDRVLQRSNGSRTYFANDIAYHLTKLERGYNKLIDVLGADHHGYVARMRAAIEALTGRGDVLEAPLIQFVSLYRGTEKAAMSTRAGEFVTLRELRQEVGDDAARFFYIMRKADVAMDFDLELAKSKSNENPVYYIQYAHARVCSVLRQLAQKNISWEVGQGIDAVSQLSEDSEHALLKTLARYPEVLVNAAKNYEPQLLGNYLRELATEFHTYYNTHQFIVDDESLRNARLNLICAIKQVLANGLALLGVSAPEEM